MLQIASTFRLFPALCDSGSRELGRFTACLIRAGGVRGRPALRTDESCDWLPFDLHILADRSVHLQQFYGRAVHLDECDDHTAAWTIGFDDYLLSLDCGLKIVNLKRDMCDRFHKIRIGRSLPVPLPLDAERCSCDRLR